MRKNASAKEHAAKNRKQPCAILVLWRKYTNFCAWFAHCYCGSAIIEMPSWECRWLTLLHSSGSSPKAHNNNQLLDDLPGDVVVYKSIDTVPDQNAVTDPTKFLNSLELLGMPPHILKHKVGAPVIVLQNINPPCLYKGTWCIVRILDAIALK